MNNILTILAEFHAANNEQFNAHDYIDTIKELKEDGLNNNEILVEIAKQLQDA